MVCGQLLCNHRVSRESQLSQSRTTQSEMIKLLSEATRNTQPLDTRHTWAQAPVKFEDALGRVFPVPSEYDWDVS